MASFAEIDPLVDDNSPIKTSDRILDGPTNSSVYSHFSGFLSPNPSPDKFQKVNSQKFRYLSYIDPFPVLKKISKSRAPLTLKDIPIPFETFNMERKVYLTDKEWHTQNIHAIEAQPKRSLLKTLIAVHKRDFIICLIVTFFLITCHLFGAFVLGKIMSIITAIGLGEETNKSQTLSYAIYFAILYFLNMVFVNWYMFFAFTLGANMRLSLTGFIYKKLHAVALSSLKEFNVGKVINMLANDLNEFDSGPTFLVPMFLAPYTILLSCYIMWGYFGAFSLLSISLQTAIMVFVIYMANLSAGPRAEKNLATDQRIKNTNEFIENIRLIKLYAWEKPLMKVISAFREKEVIALKKLGLMDSIARALTDVAVSVSLLTMCVCYVLSGGVLTAEKIYASMLILSFAKYWVTLCLHFGRTFIVSARLTLKRLESVLEINEIIPAYETSKRFILQQQDEEGDSPKKIIEEPIQYKNFTAYWSNSAQTPCLKEIDLTVQRGQLIALVGKIGSGKTTFLLSLLKEIPITSGKLVRNGSVAYVEQEPIIFSGSVRDNVLFGREFEESFYSRVLLACNLDEDLKQLDHQDQTIIGERGVTLSGGQKARISLARALYARSDIYLLDDPLSAVDSRVGKIIFEKAVKEILKDKTVIMVTHHLHYAKEADKVVVLRDGSIQAEGSFNEILKLDLDLFQTFNEDKKGEQKDNPSSEVEEPKKEESSEETKKSESETIVLSKKKQAVAKEEATIVSRRTYLNFIKEGESWKLGLVMMGSYALAQIFVIAYTRYLGYWAQKHNETYYQSLQNPEIKVDDFKHFPFIFGSIVLILILICLQFTKAYLTSMFLLDSDTKLHQKMLHKISRTFVSFFDSTPIGTILNRFSNDLGTLDRGNWMVVYDFISLVSALIFYMAFLCIINFTIAVSCLVLIIGLYRIKNFYALPLIRLKGLELVTRSPVFSELSATLNGLVIIRVYGQGHRYLRKFIDFIYENAQIFVFYTRCNRTFSISLQIFLYCFSVTGVFFFIYVAYSSNIAAGAFGLAMVYLIIIGDESTWGIRQTVFLDVNMQSAERIQQYCIMPEEAPAEITKVDSKLENSLGARQWPHNGHLEFQNVYLKYPQTNSHALDGLSFTVEPNCKVGIVGRTGAGKSSIIQALFRIVEIEDRASSFIKIDGVNITTMGLEKLRGSLSILPQTPVIFSGTIRRNLDPLDDQTDEKLWDALEKVELKNYIKSLEKGLDTDISGSGSVFSAGQKQLLCLARVVLRKSKVVVLDEATANVDMETDKIIQDKINQIFEGCVVLTIAHRLSTIAHYDKVLVMDQGVLAEYDHPYKLLVKTEGDTGITREDGMFATMVKKTGEKMSKEIFNKAYAAFYQAK